jgi:acetoin utilization protein AcuC
VLPVIRHLRPQAIMLQCGADAVEEDPLSRLALSNAAHRAVVAAVMPLAPRLIVLGGGGYNPWSVARCWAGVWATLNGLPIPPRIPPAAEVVLRGLAWSRAAGRNPPDHWFSTIADTPRHAPVRADIRELAALTLRDLPDPPGDVASSAA